MFRQCGDRAKVSGRVGRLPRRHGNRAYYHMLGLRDYRAGALVAGRIAANCSRRACGCSSSKDSDRTWRLNHIESTGIVGTTACDGSEGLFVVKSGGEHNGLVEKGKHRLLANAGDKHFGAISAFDLMDRAFVYNAFYSQWSPTKIMHSEHALKERRQKNKFKRHFRTNVF